ncbi:MAG: hypothetical protein HYV26_18685 [Candidatus Hydrogenedentes bacterium]|nr:hypothetical protein [Candidatus Hydrogenedentota bacterium]MBI3117559.1 hypothetical protein [Candidatus Hydrogenedentota bacterium]
MTRASQLFTETEKAHIEEAVTAAEAKTSAEIVPAVCTASGRYDRAEDIAGLWLGAILVALAWLLLPWERSNAGSWGLSWDRVQLPAMLLGLVAGFILGAALASRIAWLRRLFTSRKEMQDEVAVRARQIFYDQRVHHTAGCTGVLLYISLYERMAAVIADGPVVEKLGQPAVDQLCHDLTMLLRRGTAAEALSTVVAQAGERLATVFPRESSDRDELSNKLVLLA